MRNSSDHGTLQLNAPDRQKERKAVFLFKVSIDMDQGRPAVINYNLSTLTHLARQKTDGLGHSHGVHVGRVLPHDETTGNTTR